tara:strand:- start:10532 stop:10765 length:234 start_codon:yes stop_codon:yes gene_type:complete
MSSRTYELIGVQEIANLLEKDRQTIVMWKHQGKLPEPMTYISNTPIWNKTEFVNDILLDDFIMTRIADDTKRGLSNG